MKLVSVPQRYNTSCGCHPEYESGEFSVTDVETAEQIAEHAGRDHSAHGSFEHYLVNPTGEVLAELGTWYDDELPVPEWIEITSCRAIGERRRHYDQEAKRYREEQARIQKERELSQREQRERDELARLRAKYGAPAP